MDNKAGNGEELLTPDEKLELIRIINSIKIREGDYDKEFLNSLFKNELLDFESIESGKRRALLVFADHCSKSIKELLMKDIEERKKFMFIFVWAFLEGYMIGKKGFDLKDGD